MKVPDEIRKCALFVCYRNPNGIVEFGGTAFAVGLEHESGLGRFGYIVTAKHVIAGIQSRSCDGKVLLRVNLRSGGTGYIETDVADWLFHPDDDSVDVAAFRGLPMAIDADHATIPVDMAATADVLAKAHIDVGYEVFLVGLFVNHAGAQRNQPIVRTGSIALMPEEKVAVKEFGPIDAFLIEARSIGGLSGSPVFVYTDTTYLDPVRHELVPRMPGQTDLFYWLGLMHGHFDAPLSDNAQDNAFSGETVNMGIAIVIPATKIMEVINQEAFVKERNKIVADYKKSKLPTADAAEAGLSKEQFDSALKKASRRKGPSRSDQAS